MTKQIDNLKSGSDIWKRYVVIAIVIAALAFYYFTPFVYEDRDYFLLDGKKLYKVLITLVLFVIAGAFFLASGDGDRFLYFVKETRIELRKVVWPSREETVKTTGMVMIAVIVVAIFLWIVDAFFTWGVKSISLLF